MCAFISPLPSFLHPPPSFFRSPSCSHTPAPNLSDWRSFRARLVHSELPTTETTPNEISQEWAHQVPFIEPGCLLIASPEHFVGEHACSFFANTVVLVISHGARAGTVGVILNRPVSETVAEPRVRAALDGTPAPLYLGGPVALDSLLAVHDDESLPGAIRIVEGVATSAVGEALRRVEGGVMGRDKCRLFCGYSGWKAGQLGKEVEEGVWYCCSCCTDVFMKWGKEQGMVRRLLGLMGGRFREIGERMDEKDGGRFV